MKIKKQISLLVIGVFLLSSVFLTTYGQSIKDSHDTGFMSIKYGTKWSEARKIITNVKLGEIDEKKTFSSELLITCRSDAKCNLGVLSSNKSNFVGTINLLFFNDQFYQAIITYDRLDIDPAYDRLLFAQIRDALNSRYYKVQQETYNDDYDAGDMVKWTFKRAEGGTNEIILGYSFRVERVSINLISPGLHEEFTRAFERRKRGEELYSKGEELYKEKKYELAVIEYTKAIKTDPENELVVVYAYHKRGHSYHNLKKNDLAVADFTSALIYDPENSHYLNDRAKAYATWSDDKLELALADLVRAIKIKPEDTRPYILRSQIYCYQGKKALAAADEKEIIKFGGTVTKPCQQ